MPSVFISHSSRDSRWVSREILPLLLANDMRLWEMGSSISGGEDWEQKIREGIQGCDVVLVVISKAARKDPRWIRRELLLADHSRKRIVPIRRDETPAVDVDSRAAEVQVLDLSQPDRKVRRDLLLALGASTPHVPWRPPWRALRRLVVLAAVVLALSVLWSRRDDLLGLLGIENGTFTEQTVGGKTLRQWIATLDDSYYETRADACTMIGHFKEGGLPALPSLMRLVRSDVLQVRTAAVSAIGNMGNGATAAIPALRDFEAWATTQSSQTHDPKRKGELGAAEVNSAVIRERLEGS